LKVNEIEVFVVHDDELPVAMILGRNAIDALQLQFIQRNYGKMSVFDNNKFDLTTSCASLFYNTMDNKINIDIKEGQLNTENTPIEQWMNDMDYLCAGVTTELNTNLDIGSEFGFGNREKCCKLICESYLNVLSTKLAEPVAK